MNTMQNSLVNLYRSHIQAGHVRVEMNGIAREFERMFSPNRNVLTNADGYKYSQYLQYPEGTTYVASYIEARVGAKHSRILWCGLQAFLKETLTVRITKKMVDKMAKIAKSAGAPFNYDGFMRIVNEFDGRWPLRIRALPEGAVVKPGTVLALVENTHPDFFWCTSFIETMLLRAAWYMTTVATVSKDIYDLCLSTLEEFTDLKGEALEMTLKFMLNDFGARGATCHEAAVLGGMGHLMTGFRGSDTTEASEGAELYYNHNIEEDAPTKTVPASEHSTAASEGEEGEHIFNSRMIKAFGDGFIFASVCDSFDHFKNVAENWLGKNRVEVDAMNARLVIRPDSGDPVDMALATVELLDEKVGSTPNSKGLKVLHPKFRVIYGDGIDYDTILGIFTALIENGYSPENICFGMGGALLQKCDRDWERFAMKACELEVMGVKRHVGKKPKTDPSKTSKFGIYTPHLVDAEIVNVAADGPIPKGAVEVFPVVFENGFLLKDWSLDEISLFSAMQ